MNSMKTALMIAALCAATTYALPADVDQLVEETAVTESTSADEAAELVSKRCSWTEVRTYKKKAKMKNKVNKAEYMVSFCTATGAGANPRMLAKHCESAEKMKQYYQKKSFRGSRHKDCNTQEYNIRKVYGIRGSLDSYKLVAGICKCRHGYCDPSANYVKAQCRNARRTLKSVRKEQREMTSSKTRGSRRRSRSYRRRL